MKYTASIAAILLFVSCLNLFSQFEKRTLAAGGNVDLYLEPSDPISFQGSLKPAFGFFALDNFLIGIQPEILLYTAGDYTDVSLGLGPIIRYYYGKEKTSIFGHFSYSGSVSFSSYADGSTLGNIFLPGVGVNYMLAPNVGLESMLGLYLGDFGPTFSLSFGFQVFFPPGSKATSTD